MSVCRYGAISKNRTVAVSNRHMDAIIESGLQSNVASDNCAAIEIQQKMFTDKAQFNEAFGGDRVE